MTTENTTDTPSVSSEISQEIAAMSAIASALEPLGDGAIRRVLAWATDQFGVQPTREVVVDPEPVHTASTLDPERQFHDLADLFYAADPHTEAERTLVVGYWQQHIEGSDSLDGYAVNKQLKELGRPVSNITNAFTDLMNRQPRLALQVRKSGTTKQARKKYRLTHEGIRYVETMISTGGEA